MNTYAKRTNGMQFLRSPQDFPAQVFTILLGLRDYLVNSAKNSDI